MTTTTTGRARIPGADTLATAVSNAVLIAVALEAPAAYPAVLAVALIAVGAAIAARDARTHTIADRHTRLLAASGLIQAVLLSATRGTALPLLDAIGCAGAAASIYLALGLAGIVGLGDVKLAGALAGAVSLVVGGWALLLPVGALCCACCYQLLLAVLRHRCRRPHAHAPALAVATALLIAIPALHL